MFDLFVCGKKALDWMLIALKQHKKRQPPVIGYLFFNWTKIHFTNLSTAMAKKIRYHLNIN